MEREKKITYTVLSQSKKVKSVSIAVPKFKEPFLKRPLDVILSVIMIMLSIAVSLPLDLLIKLEDNGPIFYRQERWGAAHGARSRGIAQSVDKRRAGSWHRVS
jgi:lipopolysaccharide/colanic/teichoic acid biosynthesis glycosyltransferase